MARSRLRYRPPTRQIASAGAIAHEGDSEEHCFKHLLEPIRDLAMGWCRTCCGMSPVGPSTTVWPRACMLPPQIEAEVDQGDDSDHEQVRRVCACVLGPQVRACVQICVHAIERARALPLTWRALTPGREAGWIGSGHGAARVAGWARTMGAMRTVGCARNRSRRAARLTCMLAAFRREVYCVLCVRGEQRLRSKAQ